MVNMMENIVANRSIENTMDSFVANKYAKNMMDTGQHTASSKQIPMKNKMDNIVASKSMDNIMDQTRVQHVQNCGLHY